MTEKTEDALNDVVNAWERLPGGRRIDALIVEAWLIETMAPAINRARRVLGRKKPDGSEP